jgi:hypothetical protein
VGQERKAHPIGDGTQETHVSDEQHPQDQGELAGESLVGNPPRIFAEVDAAMLAGLHPSAQTLTATIDPTGSTLAEVVGEPILATVVDQSGSPLPWPLDDLDAVVQQDPVLLQQSRLQGARTGRVWQTSGGVLMIRRVDTAVVDRLRHQPRPLLQALWEGYPDSAQYQVLSWHCGPSTDPAVFGLPRLAPLVTRRLRVLVAGRPVALVEETFPAEDGWPEATSPAREAT